MSKRTRWILLAALAIIVAAAIVLFFLFLPFSQPAPTASPTPTSVATPSAAPVAADALVVVRTVATDSSGASLALTMVVHRPVDKDDPSVVGDLARLDSDCARDANLPAVDSDAGAGIERIDITASQQGSTEWPAASEIPIMPLAGNLKTSSGAIIAPSASYANSPPLPRCQRVLSLYGAGRGTLTVFLSPRETVGSPLDSPNTFRWLKQEYGFFASQGPEGGLSFAHCTVEVTDAARDFGWTADAWHETEDQYSCNGSGVFI
ncbi:MAG: hypothetical protein EPN91_10035 [Salinibacterium sp.]|nr:MAG: hypothetical protein EPN91_10035 [Salinibacterium sp.]